MTENQVESGGASVRSFLKRAAQQRNLNLPDSIPLHRIGDQAEMIDRIYELIRSGDKTGTFAVPWLEQRAGRSAPKAGDYLVLVDFGGEPQLLVRLVQVQTVQFGEISARHTALDGPTIRAVELWKTIHTQYWNSQLQAANLEVTDEMPVWVKQFELLYAD